MQIYTRCRLGPDRTSFRQSISIDSFKAWDGPIPPSNPELGVVAPLQLPSCSSRGVVSTGCVNPDHLLRGEMWEHHCAVRVAAIRRRCPVNASPMTGDPAILSLIARPRTV